MEVKFPRTMMKCLKPVLREVQNQEQTQEIRLSDEMPDVGRIVGAWAQPITRGKEWRGDSVGCSGGCMVWVMYAPENGTEPRMLDTWIPFQMKWNLPSSVPEGAVRMACRVRFADARSVSPRKILARVGLAALAEAYVPMEAEIPTPENVPQDVQLQRRTYPVRLPMEVGEKVFTMEEEMQLPSSAPAVASVLSYSVSPRTTEQKVMSGRLLFRGNANLHMLYLGEDGQVYSWDFPLPFSQLGQLDDEYSPDAQADMNMGVTDLELNRDEDGKFHCKCSMVGQYRVSERQDLELTTDAYSPRRNVQPQMAELELPSILDSGYVNLYGEKILPVMANIAVETRFLPDFPRNLRTEQGFDSQLTGQAQMLYYDENRDLQMASAQWEDTAQIPAADDTRLHSDLIATEKPDMIPGGDETKLRWPMELTHTTMAGQPIPMVTGLELGEENTLDPSRPSLILKRQPSGGLWELAKATGSTVEAIRQANGLTAEPEMGKMLLIPVL